MILHAALSAAHEEGDLGASANIPHAFTSKDLRRPIVRTLDVAQSHEGELRSGLERERRLERDQSCDNQGELNTWRKTSTANMKKGRRPNDASTLERLQ